MRVKKKKSFRNTSPALHTAGKNSPFWYACILALLCSVFWAGMSVVGLRASENQYITSYAVVSLEPVGTLSWKLSVLGWESYFDFSALNYAAEWTQKLFPLIPAPLRFGKQIAVLSENAFEQLQEMQRQRDFIENI